MAKRSSATGGGRVGSAPNAQTRLCVLYGVESMLMKQHFESLRDALQAKHGEIDTIVFDGETASLADVLDELRSMSLLGPYKLVVVDSADRFVTTHRSAIERYAQSPVDHATLVLRGPKWHKGNLDKLIAKVGCVIRCDQLSAVQAKQWLVDRAGAGHGQKLASDAAAMLINRLGTDLFRLDGELAKLAATVSDDESIGTMHVEALVGRSSDEQAWAVQEVVLASLVGNARGGGTGRAIEKVHELIDHAGQAEVLVLYFVADLFRKLYVGVMMQRQGYGDQRIAEHLKLWGSRRTAFMNAVRRLDERRAAMLFDRIVKADMRAKSGLGRGERNLECFCAAMTDESR